ncbi:hypothetical protein AB6F62_09980 [Providencia huaxiensis]
MKHKTAQIAADGSQKLPQRLLDSIMWHQSTAQTMHFSLSGCCLDEICVSGQR